MSAPTWYEQAACRDADPETYYPVSETSPAASRAKYACDRCPVRGRCLDYALAGREYGIWGGMTERERAAELKRRKANANTLQAVA